MPSRKVSNNVFYPFVPFDIAAYEPTALAIRDLFITVQGNPTESSLVPGEDRVELHTVTDSGVDTTLSFSAYHGAGRWDFDMIVPDNDGILEVALTGVDIRAVIIVDSDALSGQAATGNVIQVEPCRVQWYVEQVNKITVANIRRLNGIEEPDVQRDVLELAPIPSNPLLLQLGPGHNTEWFSEGTAVAVDVTEGGGKGRVTDLGDTVPGGDPLPQEGDVVYVINGVKPTDGNIPISTSGSLGLETADGLITVVVKE